MDYDNTNRGALFRNQNKKTDKHPDYTGTLNVEGVDRWISAWLKTSQKGEKYLSISLGDIKEQQTAQQQPAPQQTSHNPDGAPFVDDIPF